MLVLYKKSVREIERFFVVPRLCEVCDFVPDPSGEPGANYFFRIRSSNISGFSMTF
ncbi:hypothetical protein LX92_00721, partial [Maribacter polysiphoniae]